MSTVFVAVGHLFATLTTRYDETTMKPFLKDICFRFCARDDSGLLSSAQCDLAIEVTQLGIVDFKIKIFKDFANDAVT